MVNLRWDGDDFRNSKDSSGATADLVSHSGKLQQGYRHGSLTRGLVAYYPFDGDVQDYALDNHGNDNTSAGYTSGKIGSDAKDFDGTDDYIETGQTNSHNFSELSVSAWVNPSSLSSDSEVVRKWSADNAVFILRINSDGTVTFYVMDDTYSSVTISSIDTIPTGSFTFLTGVYNGSEMRIYINGVLNNSASQSFTPYTSTEVITIGSETGGTGLYFDGSIDDVRIYDRALSFPEIKALSSISNSSIVSPSDTLQ